VLLSFIYASRQLFKDRRMAISFRPGPARQIDHFLSVYLLLEVMRFRLQRKFNDPVRYIANKAILSVLRIQPFLSNKEAWQFEEMRFKRIYCRLLLKYASMST
jgi:ribosome-associated toxin RatA of RatAB toxin-antitoxin module